MRMGNMVRVLVDTGELAVGSIAEVLWVAEGAEYPFEVDGSFNHYAAEELQLVE